jgi:hypothetical protein
MRALGYALLPALALVAACQNKEAPAAQAELLTFHEIMKDQVDKHADELWDMTNQWIGEKAGIDPAKMTDERWEQLAAKSDEVQKAALTIVGLNPVLVVKPGVKISDEGEPGGHTGAMVQARVDKDPQHLRDMAQALADHMADLSKAARAHDAGKAGPLIDQLDGVCENCHLDFWYPDQKELVNQYRNAAGPDPSMSAAPSGTR